MDEVVTELESGNTLISAVLLSLNAEPELAVFKFHLVIIYVCFLSNVQN